VLTAGHSARSASAKPLPDVPCAIKPRGPARCASPPAFHGKPQLSPVAAQEPKIGNAKMSFTVTTTISINTSAMPVR
jgi:hypothetical protein